MAWSGTLLVAGAGVVAAAALWVGACGSPFTATPGDGGPSDGGPDNTVGDGPSDVLMMPDVVEEAPARCADTPGFACVPAVPLAWAGPYEVYVGPSPAPGCTDDHFGTTAFAGHDGLDAGSPSCGCDCQPSVTCTPPAVQLYTNGTCDDASACDSLQLDAGECQPSVTANCTPFAISAGPPALSVQCTPVADADVPPLGWNNDVTVCASDVGHARSDCPADQICQPRPGSGFGPKLCIGISGASGCPQDSPYSVGAVYYEDATDTRQCAACTCGNPSGFGCTATVLEMTDCTTQTGMDDTPFSCKMLTATNSLGMQVVSDDAGTCPPVGGDPQGTATGANPVTICCLP